MPPIATSELALNGDVDYNDLKAKVVTNKVEVEREPPVADNFMYDFKYNHALPTSDVLGIEVPLDCDAQKEAEGIVARLSEVMGSRDAQGFAGLFLEYGVWRDKLSFTWDYRTFNFRPAILRAATDLFAKTTASNFKFLTPAPQVSRPHPDYSQLQFIVSFETELVIASAVVNAVLTKEGWRIYTMHSVAEELKDYPEKPPKDGHMTGLKSWERQRAEEIDAANPEVLIIGGGQNGLALAARCEALGMDSLIIERSEEIGDVWKKRYEYLSLHFPHWADDLPYFSYPKHWPTYTPAQKQGKYMEWYASAMELNVWCKSSVVEATQTDGGWTVTINKEGKERRILHPKHLVMATSLCGVPMTPVVPGMAQFKGTIRHSTAHDSSRGFKKVCVVGTSSSGFDTAYECSRLGIDVTLLQRSPTYIMSLTHSVPRMIGNYAPDRHGNRPSLEEQDRLFFATPTGPGEELARRNAKVLEDLDRPLLDALNSRGLRTWRGQRGTGGATLGQTRNGGFYFDAGACEHVINGKIKVEQGFIERFTEDKVILSGGREREFDLVVFATGFSNTIDSVRATLGEKIAAACGPIWGIDEEGEVRTAYRESGVPNLCPNHLHKNVLSYDTGIPNHVNITMSNYASIPDFDSLPPVKGMPQGCAWGVFDKEGKKDPFGCLNLLTPAVVKEAYKEAKDGVSVSLNWAMNAIPHPPFGRNGLKHRVISEKDGPYSIHVFDDEVAFNTQCSSQWDSLVHYHHQATGTGYNGCQPTVASLEQPFGNEDKHGDIPTLQHWHKRGGLVGRGVLLDYQEYAAAKGIEYDCFSDHRITVQELEDVAAYQGTEFKLGDILLLKTGYTQALDEAGPEKQKENLDRGKAVGVDGTVEAAKWFWNKHFAAVAGDALAFETLPPRRADGTIAGMDEMVLHPYFLSLFGLHIGELWDLRALGQKCKELGRYSFLLSSAPLNVAGCVASPPNALAMF
ncbi:hypothetical protein ABEF93_007269 [Exophiala dermatitidis]